MQFHLALKDSTQVDRVLAPGMEELRAIAKTHIAHMQVLILNGKVDIRLIEDHGTHTVQITPHIIDVGTYGKPIQDIKAETTVNLADISVPVKDLRIMRRSGYGVSHLDVIAHRAEGLQAQRHGDPLFVKGKLHGHIFQVTVRLVLDTSGIAIMAPVGTGRHIKHKGKRITGRVRGRLRRVNRTIITHTETYSTHGTITRRHILVKITVRITRVRRTGHILRR